MRLPAASEMPNARPVRSLTVHANYTCRHSNACCSAGWTIPVEQPLQMLLGAEFLTPEADGACRFLNRPSRLCSVQHAYGEPALPASCFQFPRRALIDERGVAITLSHFCPTAAEGLFADEPLAVVEHPVAFPPDRVYEGLDARGEWPPLVAPRLLFDWDTYTRWERFLVEALGESGCTSPIEALRRIATVAERLRAWRPSEGPLSDYAAAVIAANGRCADPVNALEFDRYARFSEWEAYAHVLSAIPDALSGKGPPGRQGMLTAATFEPAAVAREFAGWVAEGWRGWARVVGRYLAAKAFGSWAAYQASGVRTLIAELAVSELVLRVETARTCAAAAAPLDRERLREGIRSADWLLMHLVERQALMAWLGTVELT